MKNIFIVQFRGYKSFISNFGSYPLPMIKFSNYKTYSKNINAKKVDNKKMRSVGFYRILCTKMITYQKFR